MGPILFVLFLMFCFKMFIHFWKWFSWRKISQTYFWKSVWKSIWKAVRKFIRKAVHTNTTWRHKNKLTTQIQIGYTNTTWQQKYNRATQIQIGLHKYNITKRDIGESSTASSLSCLVAAKVATSLSFESFSLTGFVHDDR